MRTKTPLVAGLLFAAILVLCAGCDDSQAPGNDEPVADTGAADLLAANAPAPTTIETETADGVTIYGQTYYGDLGSTMPLILLFHQGGSNGRGEYSPLITWLNESGYRAIAWDQRSGGETHGEANRTVAGLPAGSDPGYCDVYPDLEAALDYVAREGLAENVVVWGSSYSGSLVFRLAADHPDRVSGVIAFSPASGGPMAECRASLFVEQVEAPILVLRPASEMARDSSLEQQRVVSEAGASFLVVENGVHGSSMLVDERTEYDMSATRAEVVQWLDRLGSAPE